MCFPHFVPTQTHASFCGSVFSVYLFFSNFCAFDFRTEFEHSRTAFPQPVPWRQGRGLSSPANPSPWRAAPSLRHAAVTVTCRHIHRDTDTRTTPGHRFGPQLRLPKGGSLFALCFSVGLRKRPNKIYTPTFGLLVWPGGGGLIFGTWKSQDPGPLLRGASICQSVRQSVQYGMGTLVYLANLLAQGA